jgi:hypothetical protein
MTGWRDLEDELAAWEAAGLTATFWWRDDDAIAATSALERLGRLATAYRTPVAIAAIPASCEASLGGWLRENSDTCLLQHGYAHQNHAPEGRKKAELGAGRPEAIVLAELATGLEALRRIAPLLPVLVPPWNRMALQLELLLPDIGYRGVSGFGPRARAGARLKRVNTHIDPIAWRGGRAFAGEDFALGQACGHLAARRRGLVDPGEPTGLLTHHLVQDAATWDFLAQFLARTSSRPSAKWIGARELWNMPA